MELRQLKYFVAVAEASNYVGAGERLNMHRERSENKYAVSKKKSECLFSNVLVAGLR